MTIDLRKDTDFSEFPIPIQNIRIKPKYSIDTFDENSKNIVEVILDIEQKDSNLFILRLKHIKTDKLRTIEVEAQKTRDANKLEEILRDGNILCKLKDYSIDGSIGLLIAKFRGTQYDFKEIDISFDEDDETLIKNLDIKKGNKSDEYFEREIIKKLEDKCNIVFNNENYFCMLHYSLDWINDEFKKNNNKQDEEEDDEIENIKIENYENNKGNFCIVCNDYLFKVSEKEWNNKKIYIISKFTKNRHNINIDNVQIAKGKLNFKNRKNVQEINKEIEAVVKNSNKVSDYIKKWDEYGNIEGTQLLKKAREFGYIQYIHRKEESRNNKEFVLELVDFENKATKKQKEMLIKNLEIECIKEKNIDYLNDLGLDYQTLEERIVKDENIGRKKSLIVDGYNRQTRRLRLISLSKRVQNIPEQGYLIKSLKGDATQIRRKVQARNRINSSQAALPTIRYIFDETKDSLECMPGRKIKVISEGVRRIFKNNINSKQKDAIDIALNTPDIALIQGPPGTGKTRVICAILQRLYEECIAKKQDFKGEILLSGYQHVAVENMIKDIKINSLPTIKFGRSSKDNEDNLSKFEKELKKWSDDKCDEIRKKYPEIQKTLELEKK